MIVDVVGEERYWYPDDGGQVWVAGYQLVDGEGRFMGRDGIPAQEAAVRVDGLVARDPHLAAVVGVPVPLLEDDVHDHVR